MPAPTSLPFTEEPAANELLATNPLALLVGMLLDQQIQMEKAFRGPYDLQQRLGRELTAQAIVGLDADKLEELFRVKPAIHRFPGSMAKRTHQLCEFIVDTYDGSPERIWEEAADGNDLYMRLRALPGYGEAKARIFVGLLAKRIGVTPDGWEEQAADWPSIADVAEFDDIYELREKKRAMKEAKS